MANRQDVATILTASVGAFGTFAPSAFELRGEDISDEKRRDVRRGYLIAATFVLTIGLALSTKTDSSPMLISAAIVVPLVAYHEWAARTERGENARGSGDGNGLPVSDERPTA